MIDEQGLIALGRQGKQAARIMRKLSRADKDVALLAMAAALRENTTHILTENQADIDQTQTASRPESFIERMTLTEDRVEAMANGLEQVAGLSDPIGRVDDMWINRDGLEIGKRRVPLGVIGIIYESRPNVTADAAALCFKSGNAVILRGGKETIRSNQAILDALQTGLKAVALPAEAIQLIDNPDRDLATKFMQLNEYVDCLIPRGSASLINNVVRNATVPTIETGVGNDHLYVHKDADLDKAINILVNGKTQRVSVCNALENLLVDKEIAAEFIPRATAALKEYKVKLHGDKAAQALAPEMDQVTDDHYATEFLDFELAVRVVDDYDQAIEHIIQYSTGHTEVIVTENYTTAKHFVDDIDSAIVMVNASSRFSDGEVFGFGGEIGISTQKLHARGPMGLEALTSYKYTVFGEGQVRQ